MNIKPAPEQVREWIAVASQGKPLRGEPEEYERIAELAAAWGAEQAQQTTEEPELPEAVGYTYQNRYTDQHYLTWNRSDGGKNWEALYTATQMHDHYQAGVRAAMATVKESLTTGIRAFMAGGMTCKNCAFWVEQGQRKVCCNQEVTTLLESYDGWADLATTEDFGCNRWEKKA